MSGPLLVVPVDFAEYEVSAGAGVVGGEVVFPQFGKLFAVHIYCSVLQPVHLDFRVNLC